MEILDLKKQYKHLYQPSAKEVVVVDVPRLTFARIDGEIEPGYSPGNSPAFQEAVAALYGIAYTLKFMLKKRPVAPVDYPVMALEGLWWTDDGSFDQANPTGWKWTAQIMQPDRITADVWEEGLAELRKKRAEPAIERLRLESVEEGLSIQIMHFGPYKNEPETLAKMDAFSSTHGYRFRGPHHEIYLGDPRRADPAKMKTVLRHPVLRVE